VTYDLRLFRGAVLGKGAIALPSYRLLRPEALIFNEMGLTKPSYQMPELEPCTVYFWTVRARYLLDGRPQATEWAWPYSLQLSLGGPWRFRRTAPTWSDYPVTQTPKLWPEYAPFSTPPREGEKCDLH